MKRAFAVMTLCSSLLRAGTAGADDGEATLSPANFAYSIALTPAEPRPVHGALVPLAVYRGVRSAELPDIRVYNAAGEQVSHAVRTLDERRQVELGAVELAFFPLYAARADTVTLDALSLRVERDARGTVIDVRPAEQPKPAADAGGAAAIKAYVLDCSKLDRPLVALQIELQRAASDYVLPVIVESSDDLASFDVVSSGKALVSLEYAGQRIERKRIELPALRARYLRLRWAQRELPSALVAVRGELGSELRSAARETLRVRGQRRDAAHAIYDFDLGGFVPVDRVRVVLPDDNMLVHAELGSHATIKAPAVPVFDTALYRISLDGERIESPAQALPRRQDRYWQLQVDPKGGGLGAGVPELEVEYYPDQLLFVSRGAPPYELVYGHHSAKATSFAAREILSLLPPAQRDQLLQSDTVCAAPRARAGAAALKAPPPPPPWKRYALWAILIAGTLVLAVSAFRLARNVAKSDG
jgi:hypothetical protein